MGVVELPQTVRITQGRWIRLPGTGIEVLLMGKYREDGREVVRWRYDSEVDGSGYWDLTCIYHRLYVRRVDPYGEPITEAEAIRPPIRRVPKPTPPARRAAPPVTAAFPWRSSND